MPPPPEEPPETVSPTDPETDAIVPEIGARKVVSRTSWRAHLTLSSADRRFASAVGRLTSRQLAPVSEPPVSASRRWRLRFGSGLRSARPLLRVAGASSRRRHLFFVRLGSSSFGASSSPWSASSFLPSPPRRLRGFLFLRRLFLRLLPPPLFPPPPLFASSSFAARGPVLGHEADEHGPRAARVGDFFAFFFFGFGRRFHRFFGFHQLRFGGGE